MFDIICITNRKLCYENFLERIEKIAQAKPSAILLREKDLSEQEYYNFATNVINICKKHNTICILHSFPDVAKKLNCASLHLPLPMLRTLSENDKSNFVRLGSSCHSIDEALEAEKLGCTYLTVGHIFDTDCKIGLPGRGIEFLKNIKQYISIPIFAIGGIDASNVYSIKKAGADGVCIMSSIMTSNSPAKLLSDMKNR